MSTKHPIQSLFIFLVFLFVSLSSLKGQTKHPLGVNITSDGAFVNIINATNRFDKATGFDSLGWPTSDFGLVLSDSRPVAEWSNDIDDPRAYRINIGGTYHSSFNGIATIAISGSNGKISNQYYDSLTNITTYDITVPPTVNANDGFLYLNFTATKRTASSSFNSGLTNMKVMQPGYELNSTKTFTDAYIKLLTAANFAGYRFYPIQNIWGDEPTYPATLKWSQRKLPQDESQISMSSLNGKAEGWCWEYIIELSNILKKDIWICIPIAADSEYVAALATKLKNEIDPTINIYIENSNEVWSPTQATHGVYNQAEAVHYGINFDQNYARRTVELSRWFGYVFGNGAINNRIRVVLGAQQAYGGRSDIHLNYINTTFGPPKNFVYALSPSLYFGTTNPNGDTSAIVEGMLADIKGQRDTATNPFYRIGHLDRAKKWNLVGGCVSYEGGPGVPSGGGKTNLSAQIEANRTFGIKEALKKNYIDSWFDLGGGLSMFFALESGYSRYGCWGITDDYNNPDRNFKMQAVREIIGTDAEVQNILTLESSLSLSVVPNPAQGLIEVLFEQPEAGISVISVSDILGHEVVRSIKNSFAAGSQRMKVDLHNLPNGIYIVMLRSGLSTAQTRIVVLQ